MRQAFYTSLSQSDSRAVDIGIKTQKTGHRDRGKLWNDREFRGVYFLIVSTYPREKERI